MMIHPHFDPVALRINLHFFTMPIRWYGLTYLLGFVLFLGLGHFRARRYPQRGWSGDQLDDMLFYGVLGVILGGRIGYLLFYALPFNVHDGSANDLLAHPVLMLEVWNGGMSFHGGFLGVLVGMALFARKTGKTFFQVADFVAPLVPLGLAAGRLGNFINGELYGRPTAPEHFWAMQFSEGDVPRHPSQLYELGLEGLLLFTVLWFFSRRDRPSGQVSALFLTGYGLCRFIVEFTREPDKGLGLLGLGMSMGQWLSLPMIVAGIILFVWAARKHREVPVGFYRPPPA